MAGHIGIAACSGPGAALCWETITSEAPATLGGHHHPEMTMHAFDFGEHVRLMDADDWAGVGRLLVASVRKLAATGATFVISPDNTVHRALPWAEAESPVPWLHIGDAVAAEAKRIGATRVGILGTRWLVESEVYPGKLEGVGLEWRRPGKAEREAVHGIIMGDLVYGRVTDEARRTLAAVVDRLRADEGCDAVVLGCTELPLALTPDLSPLPALDSTRLLARAAIARAVTA